MALTEKQKLFVKEYLVDLNATQAAARAGYKDPNIGRQLITKNNVSAAIQKAMKEREERLEVSQDRVIQELARIAFSDATAIARVTDGGRRVELTDTDQLTDNQRAAIAGIKEGKFGIEVKMYDKLGALTKLGEHLGIFKGENRAEEESDDGFLEALNGSAGDDWDDEDDVPV